MRTRIRTMVSGTISILMFVAISGCAANSAPRIKGHWKPVNRYAEATEAIPLHPAYVFQPSPADGTLRTMLARWAKDSNLALLYEHPADFILHAPVAQIRTSDLRQAISQLMTIYAEQRVSITTSQDRIVVSFIPTAKNESPPVEK